MKLKRHNKSKNAALLHESNSEALCREESQLSSQFDMDTVSLSCSEAEDYYANEGNIEFQFEDVSSRITFYGLINVLNILALCFITSMSLSICSSAYTQLPSSLDCIMLAVDIFHVDITSCFFVVAGFVCSFIYSSIGATEFQNFRNMMLMSIGVDLIVSGFFSVLFGSIIALIKRQFKFVDILFTIFEQTTAFCVLDVQQSLQAPHNLNVGSWPVQCFVWCLLSVHMTHESNNFLRSRFGPVGTYAIMISAVCGIILFTLFGMLHSQSNIFYANATSFTYRTLEFNLGIHFFYLINIDDVIATTFMRLINQSNQGIFFVFVCIWWSEIGSNGIIPDTSVQKGTHDIDDTSTRTQSAVCLRMYARSQCLRDHHAFLLRGCFLGVTVISTFAYEGCFDLNAQYTNQHMQKYVLTKVSVISSAVSFCWPAYMAIQLIFEITFSNDIIQHNMALMSVLQPMFLLSGAVLYSMFAKKQLIDAFVGYTNSAYDLVCDCLGEPNQDKETEYRENMEEQHEEDNANASHANQDDAASARV